MTLRKATLADLADLVALSRTTFADTYAHLNDPADFEAYLDSAFSETQMTEELAVPNTATYFVDYQNITAGYFKLNFNKSPDQSDRPQLDNDVFSSFREQSMTELERIYLIKEWQGKGLAAPMMAAIEAEAKAVGSTCLWLGVWEQNPKAMRFYEKCGFVHMGEHIFQIGSDAQRDWLMIKAI
jgi:diamine N-acetyltransferase